MRYDSIKVSTGTSRSEPHWGKVGACVPMNCRLARRTRLPLCMNSITVCLADSAWPVACDDWSFCCGVACSITQRVLLVSNPEKMRSARPSVAMRLGRQFLPVCASARGGCSRLNEHQLPVPPTTSPPPKPQQPC